LGYIVNTASELTLIAYGLKKLNCSIVEASGAFDLFHWGHLRYLQEAKKLGNFLFVSINSDDSLKKIKGENRPFVNQKCRADILAALNCVDFVYIFEETLPNETISIIQPNIYVKGSEYKNKPMPEIDVVLLYGGVIEFLDTMFNSSTKIMKILEENFKE